MPAPFTELLRTEYEPASDVMWLTGQTADNPSQAANGEQPERSSRDSTLVQGPSEATVSLDLPYKAGERFMVSFCVAGDLFFTVDCKSANVFVYDKETGRHLGTLAPGPEVHRESGWVDFRDALRATRLDDGSYLIFVEEDFEGENHRLSLARPVAERPVGQTLV